MMNNHRTFLKGLTSTVASNLISFLISTIVIIVVPKLIGVAEYGYWQLYLFYSSYVGFLHFGWNDGVYLRYGGEEYTALDKNTFNSQFVSFVLFQLLISIAVFIYAIIYVPNEDRQFILCSIAVCLVLTNVRGFLIFTLQATNRLYEYAIITIIERVFYLFLIISLISLGFRQYKLMILSDIMGKLVSCAYAIYICREFTLLYRRKIIFDFKEIYANISVGIKLMFANIASMFIIGAVRFGIEKSWDIATFGKVSLTLSISSMMMIFISAVGVVLYPQLRRIDTSGQVNAYNKINSLLNICLLALLIIYFPAKEIIQYWLPKYSDALIYMGLLFPLCFFEGKMSLLLNTYLKVLRLEKIMLRVNICCLIISVAFTAVSSLVLHNLYITVCVIPFVLFVRSVFVELYLQRKLNIRRTNNTLISSIVVLSFFVLVASFSTLMSLLLYISIYAIYLYVYKKDLIMLKEMMISAYKSLKKQD